VFGWKIATEMFKTGGERSSSNEGGLWQWRAQWLEATSSLTRIKFYHLRVMAETESEAYQTHTWPSN
jgi:hypothetical protein